jgi:purine-binding chemotaxis protein CheW
MNAYQQAGFEGGLGIHQLREDDDATSICSLLVDDRLYGIDTRRIREVLGHKRLEPVPLAPGYIGGVVPYRGDVLTVISFRALLGLPPAPTQGCVLVFKSTGEQEPAGLMVDSVGGVMMLSQNAFTANPSTLDGIGKALYHGAFRLEKGLLILLDPERLRPSRLAETELFRGRDARCGRPGLQTSTQDSRRTEERQCER